MLVEAKDNKRTARDGLQQAMDYALLLDIPFAYSSNGDRILTAGTVYYLCQQTERGKNSKSPYNLCLSDFIADKESGQQD